MPNQYSIQPWSFGSISINDIYGGQNVILHINQDIVDDLNWLRDFKARTIKEEKLREENPALKSTWDSYQTMLAIVIDTV